MNESLTAPQYGSLSPSLSDQDLLIAACLAGEESAYLAVYNKYAGSIYRLCYSLLQQKEDAEEVLQDSFEYAFRKLAHYDSEKASFKTWIYQIAISRCRNKRRRKWLPTFPLTNILEEQITDKPESTPGEIILLDERQQLVWSALGELSIKLRETAILRYYEGLTYKEIGEILSISPKTAESRMRLAHKALRKSLADKLELGISNS